MKKISKIFRTMRTAAGILRPWAAGVMILAAVGAAFSIPFVTERTDRQAMNILLIMVDTLRADHVGTYGYSRETTPNIDRFAAKSAVFDVAYSHSPWTMPSVASVLTALNPRDHGLSNWRQPLLQKHLTLAEHLSKHGFHTEAYVSHVIFEPRYHFNQGFTSYDFSVLSHGDPHEVKSSQYITDRFIDSLEKGMDQPFFTWLHYFDPHSTYFRYEEHDFGNREIDRYDSEIRFTDEHIGRLFDALDRYKLWSDTIVVFIADHGEEFRDHGGIRHTTTLFDELLRVPLIIWVPGMDPQRIETIVTESDVAPTVCELVGVPTPAQFTGRSLQFRGSGFRVSEDRTVFAETREQAYKIGVRQGDWKFIIDQKRGQEYLFNLSKDPRERRNLVRREPAVAKIHRETLKQYYGGKRSEAKEIQMTDELRQQLEALGYL